MEVCNDSKKGRLVILKANFSDYDLKRGNCDWQAW